MAPFYPVKGTLLISLLLILSLRPSFASAQSLPSITSFSPTQATSDSTVVILGSGFTGASAVSFGRVSALSFQVVSDSRITAVVGSGASGNVVVVTAVGADTLGGFTYLMPANLPVVSSFFPTSAATDSTVLIQGLNFTGATAVDFGGTPASSFQVLSGDSILAVVGKGASGSVSVSILVGTGSMAGFTYIAPPAVPVISSFLPNNAPTDSTITIHGYNFTGVTAVTFGGVPAASFRVVSADLIYAVVGSGASGNVIVTTSAGADTSGGFTYIAPPVVPFISAFSPTSGAPDSTVVIRGAHFTGAMAVDFGGVSAASFQVVSDSTITAIVGGGASGAVSVRTSAGTGSLEGFTYIAPPSSALVVTSFQPFSAPTDSTVVIQGSNFTGATAVSFGGTSASSFVVVSDNEIYAVVGAGSTGAISVTNSGGSASLAGFTYIGAPSFSLTSFTGALTGSSAQLSWQVQNEQGIAYYEVDAGQDSTSLTKLADQNARDAASDSYTFVDPTLSPGPNYFQLRIVDSAGNFTYSGIVDVTLPDSTNSVKVSPNPVKGVANVILPTSPNPSTIQIMDMNGNVYYSAGVEPNTSQVKVDFSRASGGIYIMSWSDGTRKLTKKMMVVN